MKLRKGDRFYCKSVGDVWEIVEDCSILGYYKSVCLEGPRKEKITTNTKIGDCVARSYTSSNWEYLGNFSKSDNFNNLYEKLNGTT